MADPFGRLFVHEERNESSQRVCIRRSEFMLLVDELPARGIKRILRVTICRPQGLFRRQPIIVRAVAIAMA